MIHFAAGVILKIEDFQPGNPPPAIIKELQYVFDPHVGEIKRDAVSGMERCQPVNKLAGAELHHGGHFFKIAWLADIGHFGIIFGFEK